MGWMIRTKEGLEITEKEFGYWDNIPSDIEIKSLGVGIARHNQTPYIIDVKGFEEICCAKIGTAGVGGPGTTVGIVVYCVANKQVTEFTITLAGVSLKSYPRDKLTLRPSCLRRMVA